MAHFARGEPCGTWTDYDGQSPRVTEKPRACNEFNPPENEDDGVPVGPVGERPSGDGQSCPDGGELRGQAPPDGALAFCVNSEGVKDGSYAEWFQLEEFEAPIKTVSGSYRDGQRDGDWAWFFQDGAPKLAGAFVQAERDGTWQRWWYGSSLRERMAYANDALEGSYERWFENGQLAEEGAYRHGVRHGEWVKWNEQGEQSVVEYDDGQWGRDEFDDANHVGPTSAMGPDPTRFPPFVATGHGDYV